MKIIYLRFQRLPYLDYFPIHRVMVGPLNIIFRNENDHKVDMISFLGLGKKRKGVSRFLLKNCR